MATLFVNRSDAYCGECSLGADPSDLSHDLILGYGRKNRKGCGVTWESISTDYATTLPLVEAIKKMRPDLTYIGYTNGRKPTLGTTKY